VTIFDVLFESFASIIAQWDKLKLVYKVVTTLLILLTVGLGLYLIQNA